MLIKLIILSLMLQLNSAPCLKGRVRVVTAFPDYRVRVVDHFPDLRVFKVKAFPSNCGEWQFVNAHEDFTIQYVDSFEDLTISFEDSRLR